jgi:ribosome-binding protein aMBF1 (putative translation factor)
MAMQTIEIKGERFVLVPEAAFRRFVEVPPLPEPATDGSVDAIAYARASVARDLVVARRKAGLTQAQLARLAKVRQETVSRLESGLQTITEATMKKLWRVLETHQRN